MNQLSNYRIKARYYHNCMFCVLSYDCISSFSTAARDTEFFLSHDDNDDNDNDNDGDIGIYDDHGIIFFPLDLPLSIKIIFNNYNLFADKRKV